MIWAVTYSYCCNVQTFEAPSMNNVRKKQVIRIFYVACSSYKRKFILALNKMLREITLHRNYSSVCLLLCIFFQYKHTKGGHECIFHLQYYYSDDFGSKHLQKKYPGNFQFIPSTHLLHQKLKNFSGFSYWTQHQNAYSPSKIY